MNNKITTEEGNRLIAEFMGAKENEKGWISIPHRGWEYQKKYYPHSLKYHTSFDWLMPVVEKIGYEEYTDKSWQGCERYENTPYPRTFGMRNSINGKYMFRFNAMPLFEADTLIKATWLAVIDYIQSLKQTS